MQGSREEAGSQAIGFECWGLRPQTRNFPIPWASHVHCSRWPRSLLIAMKKGIPSVVRSLAIPEQDVLLREQSRPVSDGKARKLPRRQAWALPGWPGQPRASCVPAPQTGWGTWVQDNGSRQQGLSTGARDSRRRGREGTRACPRGTSPGQRRPTRATGKSSRGHGMWKAPMQCADRLCRREREVLPMLSTPPSTHRCVEGAGARLLSLGGVGVTGSPS